jgi:hypothetical protein
MKGKIHLKKIICMVVKNTILLLLVYAGNNLIANHEKN